MATTLTTSQAVRAMRHWIDRQAPIDGELYADLAAFGAPSECYTDVANSRERTVRRQLAGLWPRLGITWHQLELALEVAAAKEAPHAPRLWPAPDAPLEPPHAYAQGGWLAQYLEQE